MPTCQRLLRRQATESDPVNPECWLAAGGFATCARLIPVRSIPARVRYPDLVHTFRRSPISRSKKSIRLLWTTSSAFEVRIRPSYRLVESRLLYSSGNRASTCASNLSSFASNLSCPADSLRRFESRDQEKKTPPLGRNTTF